MPFGFRNRASAVYELECLREIQKRVRLQQVVSADNLPAGQFREEAISLFRRQWRNIAAARNTFLGSQFLSHSAQPSRSVIVRLSTYFRMSLVCIYVKTAAEA